MEKRTPQPPKPLLMEEEYWMNTPYSIARHYGRVIINGEIYIIVNKYGQDLFECSEIAEREGRDKAIEPGEPADLIWSGLHKHYKRLKRDRILELLKSGADFETIKNTKE